MSCARSALSRVSSYKIRNMSLERNARSCCWGWSEHKVGLCDAETRQWLLWYTREKAGAAGCCGPRERSRGTLLPAGAVRRLSRGCHSPEQPSQATPTGPSASATSLCRGDVQRQQSLGLCSLLEGEEKGSNAAREGNSCRSVALGTLVWLCCSPPLCVTWRKSWLELLHLEVVSRWR